MLKKITRQAGELKGYEKFERKATKISTILLYLNKVKDQKEKVTSRMFTFPRKKYLKRSMCSGS